MPYATECRASNSGGFSLASDNLICYTLSMIAPDSTVDDFEATLTCEEFYMEREWEDEDFGLGPGDDDDFEDDEDDEDEDEDEDSEDDDEDFDDEDEDEDVWGDEEDEEWEDMEDDVSDCFDCDGTVSENGFAQLFDMERRGYFA